MTAHALAVAGLISIISTSVLLILLMRFLPAGMLLAGRNERSNHTRPTRQIGGLAVIPAILLALAVSSPPDLAGIATVAILGGTICLWVVGLLDDLSSLPVTPRLLLHLLCAGAAAAAMSTSITAMPYWAATAMLAVVVAWSINLTNFMDGLDLMLVAGIGVPHCILALAMLLGWIEPTTAIPAAVTGALAVFATVNRPPARVFMGDSGSLPLGLLSAATAVSLASQHVALAVLPFSYFVIDASSTLLLRAARGENVTAAHSSHAYQRAFRSGMPATGIAAAVAAASACSTLLAIWIAASHAGYPVSCMVVAAGLLLPAILVVTFRYLRI